MSDLAAIARVDPIHPDPAALTAAAALLRAGGLVAFPTETVYGLGANALDAAAVRRVFAAKGRPVDNPLIVHIGDPAGLAGLAADIPALASDLADRWWPGPLTLVLDATDALPAETTGGLRTVAVRMPDHPVALALLRAADLPIAAPSANRSGRPSPTEAGHVLADLGGDVDVIIDGGGCPVGVESTVVDARGAAPVVLREGAIAREQLGAVSAATRGPAASPGTRYRHYAPRCTVELVTAQRVNARAAELVAAGARVGTLGPAAGPTGTATLAICRDAAALANVLYRSLRRAEDAGLDAVVVGEVPEAGIGRAVMDRVRRAATVEP